MGWASPRERWGFELGEGTVLVFAVLTLLIMGIVAGSLTVAHLDQGQRQELYSLVSTFYQGIAREPDQLNSGSVLLRSLSSNLKTAGLVWLLGLTVIGIPVVAFIVFTRGFLVGFTVAFLVHQMGWKGIILALVSVFPQNILAIPALLALSVSSVSFSLFLVRRTSRRNPLITEFLRYSTIAAGCTALLGLAGLLEAYLVPPLMSWVSRLLS